MQLDTTNILFICGGAFDGLEKVIRLLRTHTGQDFSHYKKSTLYRRIERRMMQQGIDDMATYERFLKEHPPEVQALFRELLINVTSFFRDTAVFDMLKRDVLPALLAHRPENEALRVWVAGCATGEEAYSVAMLLRELADEHKRDWPVLIYGTDIDADRVTAFFDVAASLGVEVVTVDKGWEDHVGDWHKVRDIRDGGCILVRPDHHVAWRAGAAVKDPEGELRRVLKTILDR